ncbi:hypothetical protein E5161_17580 [Cohnella pontilimi]|uniref:Phospholipase C/D domain-containing protein n=1 Tax=Cohnella pontilimi TaxID=2564100 RepID=A0A4U0F652_9BACL|nr:zinc dependent phospholipase C family protein [Cohnella pontilimi]TJY39758.1 hypothetical protein E5161_17580 [Cohnella pontilimi]
MPNIWAHIQYGRELLAELGLAGMAESREWNAAFQLGCQGPDFLFYDHFLPWQPATPLNDLGSQMHSVRCGPFLLSLLGRVRGRALTEPAVAFSFGFLLHHLLDRHLHPFVFSRSGFRKWHHQRFETAMDAVVMHRRAGLHTGSVPVASEIDTGGRMPGGFAAEFLDTARLHYPVLAARITPDQLDQAVAQMVSAQKLFFDPTGWKGRLLFRQLEPFSPPRRLPDWDVLNDAHRTWVNPCDRTIYHTESADDLWEAALRDGRATAGAAVTWLTAGPGDDASALQAAFAGLLGDISYETGRPCGSAWITYADSVIPV